MSRKYPYLVVDPKTHHGRYVFENGVSVPAKCPGLVVDPKTHRLVAKSDHIAAPAKKEPSKRAAKNPLEQFFAAAAAVLDDETQVHEAQRRLRDLWSIVEHTPASEELPRGRPGRPGYSKEVLRYARQLRKNGMEIPVILKMCREKFPDVDMPEDNDSFRKWLTRKHKRR
jgi:hypothetical protein